MVSAVGAYLLVPLSDTGFEIDLVRRFQKFLVEEDMTLADNTRE
jgi:hypothetical protein